MLTLLENGRARARMPRTLILEPTRELAAQVEENFESYGSNHKLTVALLIGGVSFDDQNKKLDRGVDVLIATPGRLLDHFERGKLLLTGVEILVIDEADRMLDMGFIPDIEHICKLLPSTRQTLFFSATMPPEIQRLADTFLRDPVRIEVSRPADLGGHHQPVPRRCRPRAGRKARGAAQPDPRRRRPQERDHLLQPQARRRDPRSARWSATASPPARSMATWTREPHGDARRLPKDRLTLLVASDVAARGLDIPAVSHIFNFDVPTHAEDYVHRIGRTGRAGLERHRDHPRDAARPANTWRRSRS